MLRRPSLTPEELRHFSCRNSWRSAFGLIRVYALLILVISFALTFGGWWIIPAVVFIAGLQHAISILQHEAVHGLLFNNHRLNDFIGTYFLSYPIGFSLDYRITHFAHHRHLGTSADPDLLNYEPFPASWRVFAHKLLRDFSGYGAVTQFFTSSTSFTGTSVKKSSLFGIIFTQLILFAIFFSLGHPWMYFILWLLPLVTLTKGFAQFRNLAEHLKRPGIVGESERMRTLKSNFVERFFIAPLNFNYHAEHHWYMSVPYYRLPALRRRLESRPDYHELTAVDRSYVSVLRQAIQSFE